MLLRDGGPHEREGERGALPLKKHYSITIGSSDMKMVANRHRYAVYHSKHW